MISYMNQLNIFNECCWAEDIDPNVRVVYYTLLDMNNRCNWADEFPASIRGLLLRTGIKSKDTVNKALNFLAQKGFIKYRPSRTRGKPSKISIIDLRFVSRILDTTQDTTQDIIKTKSKTKTKNKNTPLPPKGEGDAFSKYTDNPELLSALRDFEAMRKAIKKPMQESTKGRMLKTLDRLASDDETKIAILNQSTDHNWQGLFELKRNAVSVSSTQGKANREDEEPECGTPAWEEWCRKKDLELFEQFQRGIANG